MQQVLLVDANKLKKLQEVRYQIRKCCGTCKNASFPANDWSTCQIHKYQHLKHSVETRNLSINAYGHCDDFDWSQEYLDQIDTWLGFLEE
jgi:hypothetical protein